MISLMEGREFIHHGSVVLSLHQSPWGDEVAAGMLNVEALKEGIRIGVEARIP